MKSTLSCLLLGLSLSAVSQASAQVNVRTQPTDEYKLPVYQVPAVSRMPQITRQVNPQVPVGLAGTAFDMKFLVTERGFVRRIKTAPSPQSLGQVNEQARDFALQMNQLLKTWRFSPALDANGRPVKVNLLMPVRVVEAQGGARTDVVLMLDESAYAGG